MGQYLFEFLAVVSHDSLDHLQVQVHQLVWLVNTRVKLSSTKPAEILVSSSTERLQGKDNSPLRKPPERAVAYQADQPVSRVLSDGVSHRDGHFSRGTITRTLQQPTRGVFVEVGNSRRLLGLAPAGVYRAVNVAIYAVGSYPTFSPLPSFEGGLFSVALSVAPVS